MSLGSVQTGVIDLAAPARATNRRDVVLRVGASLRDATTDNVLIHNLSTTGLLIETGADLCEGDELIVEMPHAGTTKAVVIWVGNRLFGCRFNKAISPAAVSAALLRAPFDAETTRHEASDARGEPQESGKSPPHQRLWLLTGLALLAWAPIAAIASIWIWL